MSEGLTYFKNVYDEVPDWIQKMHDYSPKVLDHYTGIRGEIMQDGVLSRKEKDLLIASMNAARLYTRSMVYHTKGAIDFGSTIPEMVEYFLVAYLYKGDQSLKTSLEAILYAFELRGKIVTKMDKEPETIEEILNMILEWTENEEDIFIKEVLEVIKQNDRQKLEKKILEDGCVPSKLKHLNMVGNYITELRGKDAVSWVEKSRQMGATEEELAEVGYICILTAGIPSWFELSDILKEMEGH